MHMNCFCVMMPSSSPFSALHPRMVIFLQIATTYPANFQKKYICSSKRPAAQTTPTIAPTTDLLSLPLAARSVPPTKNALHFLFSASSAHVCSVVSHVSSFPSHWHVHFPKSLSSTGVSAVLAPLGLTCGSSESMRRRQRWNIVWSFLYLLSLSSFRFHFFLGSCFRF